MRKRYPGLQGKAIHGSNECCAECFEFLQSRFRSEISAQIPAGPLVMLNSAVKVDSMSSFDGHEFADRFYRPCVPWSKRTPKVLLETCNKLMSILGGFNPGAFGTFLYGHRVRSANTQFFIFLCGQAYWNLRHNQWLSSKFIKCRILWFLVTPLGMSMVFSLGIFPRFWKNG